MISHESKSLKSFVIFVQHAGVYANVIVKCLGFYPQLSEMWRSLELGELFYDCKDF